jgi:hypothetical protein
VIGTRSRDLERESEISSGRQAATGTGAPVVGAVAAASGAEASAERPWRSSRQKIATRAISGRT